MRKEMIIRVEGSSEKGGHSKAIKVAAGIQGVESVTLAGEDRNLLLVIGVGVDSNRITKKLRQKVGHAEVVELRSVDADELVVAHDHAYRYHPSPSPYNKHHYYAGGGSGYPRDHQYHPSSYSKHQQHVSYVPPTMASGGRDYYYGSSGGGYYPAQYQYQQHQQHFYQPSNMHTMVHHEYANDDPNNCSIM
ncbi:hypothetical protein QOZ80_4AG0314160 [Eleusine coracana subsp. coracana]|nr:hypothetical protein QOZ80_4AG0314160 [Eleusine coracana subsp. coracana]